MEYSSLAHHLDSIGPNALLRKANVRNLVPSLTLREVRELRGLLETIDFRTDILARLPVKLQVFARWRHIWLQRDIVKLLAAGYLVFADTLGKCL
ncbi:hypothetical protein B0H63DRAFT_520384 [Podospora didyma]|uniref:Uncharacterized protein n=1 Tax=Podospora didyma TaxID=330526 RepID=A0AAE0P0U8_9PEZI|nr:hypothetical protein B0H63DRAFT_520384 [Podospora didyma]